MPQLSAAQWRILCYLYYVKPGNVQATLDDVMKAQETTAEDALGLVTLGLVEINRWTDEGPAYVRLTETGRRHAGSPLPSVVAKLASAERPTPVHQLIDSWDKVATYVDLCDLQDVGLIKVMTHDGQFEVQLDRDASFGINRATSARLTKRGREYVAR
jgi:hypothetical protein